MATGMPDEVWLHIVGFVDVWDPAGWRCVARLAATCTETRRALLLFCATRKLFLRSHPQKKNRPAENQSHVLRIQLQAHFPRPEMRMELEAADGALHTWAVPMFPKVDSVGFERDHICSWPSYTLFHTTPHCTFYAATVAAPRRAPPDAYTSGGRILKKILHLETRTIVYELWNDDVALEAMERFTGRLPVHP